MNLRQLAVGVSVLIALVGSAPPVVQVAELEEGIVWEKRLRAREVHQYRLSARAGELIHLKAQQESVDIQLEIRSEDGRSSLLVVDSRNRDEGVEELWWIPDSNGHYLLGIKAFSHFAAGEYTLELLERRPIGPADTLKARAIHALHKSHQIDDPKPILRAHLKRPHLEEAIDLWIASGEPYQEALVWFHLGDVTKKAGEYDRALEDYRHALDLFAELGEVSLEIDVLLELGQVHRYSGDYSSAWTAQERAFQMARLKGDRRRESKALNNQGVLHLEEGDLRRALESFHAALDRLDELQLRAGRTSVLFGLGQTYSKLGRFPDAMDYFQKTLYMARASKNQRTEASALMEMGLIAALDGRFLEAEEEYKKALGIHRSRENLKGEAGALHLLGVLHLRMGEVEEARINLQKASEIFSKFQDPRDQAHLLLRLAEIELEEGKNENAISRVRAALELLHGLHDPESRINANYLLGQALQEVPDLANGKFEMAFELLENMRRELSNQALNLSFYDNRKVIGEAYRNALLRVDPSGAQALRVEEGIRARGLLELLTVRVGNVPPESLQAKGRRLDELAWSQLNPSSAMHSGGVAITEKLRRMIWDFASEKEAFIRSRKSASANSNVEVARLEEIQEDLLDSDTVMLIFSLGKEEGRLWHITQDTLNIFSLPTEQEFSVPIQNLSQWMGEGFKQEREAGIEDVLEELSKKLFSKLKGKLTQKRIVIVADGDLHLVPMAALPHPQLAGRLIDHHEIVRIPSASVLMRLRERAENRPLASFELSLWADPIFTPDDPRLFGAEDVGTAVASTGKKGTRGKGVPSHQALELRRVLEAMGLERLDRLEGARQEAKRIVELFREVQGEAHDSLLEAYGLTVSKQAVSSGDLEDYRILHFASHAFNHPRHPELSGLLLSMIDEKGNWQDGFLRSHEIANLHLSAELVVLSACDTGTGTIYAEGPASLARSFLSAGATRVVGSLWKVSDRATAQFMEHFYRALWQEGQTPAAALRSAQLTLSEKEEYRSPYFWAAFELHGDWRGF